MAFLRVSNLKKSYRISRTDYQEVLKGINVEFKRGELVAVLGESGCGKSTFMNILGGLDNDYTGSIVLEEEFFFKDYTEKQLDDYRKNMVGLIFQNYNLISHMTIAENVEVAMTMNDITPEKRKQRAKALLKQMGLLEYADKLPNQLSGGQKQRVAIARSLANAPAMILADEPTGALDKESAAQVMGILKKIAASGRLVIVVTHSQKVANECNRILTIDDGVIKSDVKNGKLEKKYPNLTVLRTKDIRFKDLFKLAFSNVMQTKKRSFLVSLGMAIGLAAVILVFCLSSGITAYVNSDLASSMNILRLQVQTKKSFDKEDLEDFAGLEGVKTVEEGTYLRLNSTYDYGGDTGYIMMLSTAYEGIDDVLTVSAGSVCAENGQVLISEYFARNLYSGSVDTAEELVGTSVNIIFSGETTSFTISGVYEDSTDYANYPCAYVTRGAMESLYQKADKTYVINTVNVYVKNTSYISSVKSTIETLGYSVSRDDATVETLLYYIDLGTKVLTGFAGISIAVSAIMIFIVTYISVVERTKEIGILRAVGGRKKDVTSLFVLESAIIGSAAGVIAVGFSALVALVANLTLGSYGSIVAWNIWAYLFGFFASVLISVAAGFVPSLQAANLDPVEALRTE